MQTYNSSWQKRSLAAVWHPCTQMQQAMQNPPLPIARGQGPWLFDYEGQRYFDGISSWWVNLFGHSDASINQAISNQLKTLPHVMLAGCTHAPAIELAENLSALTHGHLGHVFYASDGASAVEIALKMSFHYWRNIGQPNKQRFVCLQGSYHGETLGALSVTDVAIFRSTYDTLLQKPLLIPSPACADVREQAARMQASLQALEALLKEQSEQIAAFILEPLVQCASGMLMYPPAYLSAARALCTAHHVHLIADEIAVGCGRTGKFLAWEHSLPKQPQAADYPDFITLSKGITGGTLPLSLVLSQEAIYQAFLSDDTARAFLHSHSYTGNALACAAAVAVLKKLSLRGLNAVQEQSVLLRDAMQTLAQDPRVENVRQIGLIWACDIKTEYAGNNFSERLHQAARKRELLIRPIGRSIYLMPPYVLTPGICTWLAQTVSLCIDDCSAA